MERYSFRLTKDDTELQEFLDEQLSGLEKRDTSVFLRKLLLLGARQMKQFNEGILFNQLGTSSVANSNVDAELDDIKKTMQTMLEQQKLMLDKMHELENKTIIASNSSQSQANNTTLDEDIETSVEDNKKVNEEEVAMGDMALDFFDEFG
ncbi:hypothetical protein ABD87_00165 [Lysinibacillus sphaericus]|uniref:hypothetical protein n=1 Tax=Lysinibacillus sphaericus TaxID=1421 RepID=UPI0018CE16A7|nr:hypothetical protein [Lysinibacillus sphaericus]MBG9728005.1 hypothetical protein [Lysinibacillus sphaericus]